MRDIILYGDFNQDIDSEQMQRFMRENGLLEIHENLNEVDYMQRDRTHKEGSKQIDAVLATDGIRQCMKGSLIVDFNNIVISDHRGFVFDIDIKEYFQINYSKYDTSDHVKLNPTKRSHRVKF